MRRTSETSAPTSAYSDAEANAGSYAGTPVPRVLRRADYRERQARLASVIAQQIVPRLLLIHKNSRRDGDVGETFTAEEIIVHNFVNFGIAAATPRGLLVPNIKDAEQMSMLELAMAIEQLAATAREGKTTAADMKDGTITITNIGVFGVDTGTPILNPGEVAIVALGSIRPKPWVVNNEIQVRQVTTIGATFDHRVVDGDVASRFVQDVASVIEEPALLLD
jgi:pyruvate dehydrogenase E2 component (dihydrolipoamide acetyltransferase)